MGFLVGLTMFLIFDTIKNMKQTHKTNTEKLEKILLLKEKGLTLREIGLLVGLTAEGVRYLINKFEIKKANAWQSFWFLLHFNHQDK
jgi:hypothetical protein